jgi:GTP diphosphokinase / guanosine-3',5'-bis(diphosphate) 3'-diphosphatase
MALGALARRRSGPPDALLVELLDRYRQRQPKAPTDRIERAYEVAKAAHAGQLRKSGDPYITHPVGVASVLADLGLDDVTLAGALLHDAVEDTNISLDDLEADFGADVAAIVDGVTKLDRLKFESQAEQQAATMRKMLVAMAKDIRVLLIKLADRLHNMRTIESLPQTKQQRIARETLDIYAPLAHRLGIGDIKWQLEDLSFKVLHPKVYAEIDQMVAVRTPARDEQIAALIDAVRGRLAELKISAEVTGRGKHYWSIYEKMVVRGREFAEIHDLLGIRIVVESVKDCYGALGAIHAMWRPVPGRFKDYVAMPKFNLYQSLHTTVVASDGKPLEFQIRTREMHRRAEFGVAAHWGYKEHTQPTAEDLAWLQRIVDWQSETSDPVEFMTSLKLDLESDEVFVFTPKGNVVALPTGATAVDFAYAIHTEVGHRCIGARFNGRLVPLDSEVNSGDTIEIFTSKVEGAGPSRDWLSFVQTPKATSKIRQWFSRERRTDAIDQGRDELARELRRAGLPVQKLPRSAPFEAVITKLNLENLEALYVAIGEGHVAARAVVQRLQRELSEGEEQVPSTARRPARPRSGTGTSGVHVEGLDDVMVRLSRCCTPVPGDEIMGFVTRGRGVSVHRSDCANAQSLTSQHDRVIEVEWDRDAPASYVVSVEIEALDRSKLLRDVAETLSEHHVNILACTSQTQPDRIARLRFDFELADPGHLESILSAIKRVDSVFEASRVLPGRDRG